MADAVTSQVLLDGPRNLVMKFTNISDGTGESAVTKVAAATYGTGVKINKIHYSTFGMAVRILWDATADVPAFLVPQDADGSFDFTSFGGIINDGGTGVTGNIQFTTIGAASGDTYTIILEMAKR
jgi:hypothetical protein